MISNVSANNISRGSCGNTVFNQRNMVQTVALYCNFNDFALVLRPLNKCTNSVLSDRAIQENPAFKNYGATILFAKVFNWLPTMIGGELQGLSSSFSVSTEDVCSWMKTSIQIQKPLSMRVFGKSDKFVLTITPFTQQKPFLELANIESFGLHLIDNQTGKCTFLEFAGANPAGLNSLDYIKMSMFSEDSNSDPGFVHEDWVFINGCHITEHWLGIFKIDWNAQKIVIMEIARIDNPILDKFVVGEVFYGATYYKNIFFSYPLKKAMPGSQTIQRIDRASTPCYSFSVPDYNRWATTSNAKMHFQLYHKQDNSFRLLAWDRGSGTLLKDCKTDFDINDNFDLFRSMIADERFIVIAFRVNGIVTLHVFPLIQDKIGKHSVLKTTMGDNSFPNMFLQNGLLTLIHENETACCYLDSPGEPKYTKMPAEADKKEEADRKAFSISDISVISSRKIRFWVGNQLWTFSP